MLYSIVSKINNEAIRTPLLKLLYRKNGMKLKSFRNYNNRFYIYEVNGKFIPSESLNWYTRYELLAKACDEISFFKYKPQKGDTVIDIGAGLGEEAIVMSEAVGPTGKVYSIEANPTVYRIVKDVIDLNKLTNVEVLNLAVNATDGPVTIVDTDDSYKTGFVAGENPPSTTQVEGLRFDSFIKKYGIKRIDLLKCNIEGAERFLVDSIDKSYLPIIRNVAIACHDFRYSENNNEFFVTKEYIRNFLTQNSFEIVSQNTGKDFLDDWVYGRNLKSI
jgi:FkbM family methyltransferase